MRKRIIQKTKPKVELSITLFEKMLSLAFSEYKNRPFFKKIQIFFDTIDTSIFVQDVDINPRYLILETFITMYIDDGVNDIDLIIESIENNQAIDNDEFNEIADAISEEELTLADANAIENTLIDRMNFFNSEPKLAKLEILLSDWKKGNFSSYGEIISEIQIAALTFSKEIYSKSKANSVIDYLDFSNNDFKEKMQSIHREITDEKRLIKTGIRHFNEMLGGGFAPGRVYLFLGITGG